MTNERLSIVERLRRLDAFLDENERLVAENRELRRIISELGYCAPNASLEFMALIPAEIRAQVKSA